MHSPAEWGVAFLVALFAAWLMLGTVVEETTRALRSPCICTPDGGTR